MLRPLLLERWCNGEVPLEDTSSDDQCILILTLNGSPYVGLVPGPARRSDTAVCARSILSALGAAVTVRKTTLITTTALLTLYYTVNSQD